MTNEHHGFQTVIHKELTFLISPDLYPTMPGDVHLEAMRLDLDAVSAIAMRESWNTQEAIVLKSTGTSTMVSSGERRVPLATIRTRYQLDQLTHPLAIVQVPTSFQRYGRRDMIATAQIAQKFARQPPVPAPAEQARKKKWSLAVKILTWMGVTLCLIDVVLYIRAISP